MDVAFRRVKPGEEIPPRPKELDAWASGKGGNDPKKLSDKWQERAAKLFFRDFEAMLLGHCKHKWPKVASEAWPVTSESGYRN